MNFWQTIVRCHVRTSARRSTAGGSLSTAAPALDTSNVSFPPPQATPIDDAVIITRHAYNGAKTLNWWHTHQFAIIAGSTQAVLIILFALFVRYDSSSPTFPARMPIWPGGVYFTSLNPMWNPVWNSSQTTAVQVGSAGSASNPVVNPSIPGGSAPSNNPAAPPTLTGPVNTPFFPIVYNTFAAPRERYAMFQDVHVMVFVGFGFLAAFLRRYGFSSVGLNFLLAAITIQWATLMQGFLRWCWFGSPPKKIGLSVSRGSNECSFCSSTKPNSMIAADFTAVTILVSFGAVLGRLGPSQYVLMVLVEVVLATVNEWIGIYLLKASDVGGSIFLHTFGAYFGLAVSRMVDVYQPRSQFGWRSALRSSSYHSDMFSVLGTIFLWVYWPSFNAAGAGSLDEQNRALFNTYFALAASCVVTFTLSHVLYRGDFSMELVQNATIAGGVAMGTTANMAVEVYGALLIGSCAAIVCVLGSCYLTPLLEAKLGLRDTRGVHNLHGMPGILAAITSLIVIGSTTYEQYGREYPVVFPAASGGIFGINRSSRDQVLYQFIALIITLAISIVGGVFTGALLRLVPGALVWPREELYYDDSYTWLLPLHREADTVEEAFALQLEEERPIVVEETAVGVPSSEWSFVKHNRKNPATPEHVASPHMTTSERTASDMMTVSVAGLLPGESLDRLPTRAGRM